MQLFVRYHIKSTDVSYKAIKAHKILQIPECKSGFVTKIWKRHKVKPCISGFPDISCIPGFYCFNHQETCMFSANIRNDLLLKSKTKVGFHFNRMIKPLHSHLL